MEVTGAAKGVASVIAMLGCTRGQPDTVPYQLDPVPYDWTYALATINQLPHACQPWLTPVRMQKTLLNFVQTLSTHPLPSKPQVEA